MLRTDTSEIGYDATFIIPALKCSYIPPGCVEMPCSSPDQWYKFASEGSTSYGTLLKKHSLFVFIFHNSLLVILRRSMISHLIQQPCWMRENALAAGSSWWYTSSTTKRQCSFGVGLFQCGCSQPQAKFPTAMLDLPHNVPVSEGGPCFLPLPHLSSSL